MHRKRRRQNLFNYILLILICAVLSVGIYYIYYNYIRKDKMAPQVEELVKEKKKKKYSDAKENPVDVSNYVNELPNFRNQYGNNDIMARLEIPNMNIDTLVTRSVNNSYYLNYNLYHQWDALGVPFFDYRNTDLAHNQQINIYGHNTRNERFLSALPFTNLDAYVDKNIFNNYRDVYLSIDERKVHYKAIAVKIISTDNEHMKVGFKNDVDFLKHISKLMSNTLYKSDDSSITKNDRILVLQVCHYDPPDTYLLLICNTLSKLVSINLISLSLVKVILYSPSSS